MTSGIYAIERSCFPMYVPEEKNNRKMTPLMRIVSGVREEPVDEQCSGKNQFDQSEYHQSLCASQPTTIFNANK